MISKSLSTSRKFAKLGNEFAQILYVLIVAHADDHGRQSGDAFTVKHQVFPISPRSEEEFAAALLNLEACGLIELYPHDDEMVMSIVNFDDHQSGLHKRTKSRFPDSSGKFPETPGNSGNPPEIPSEEKRTELKGNGTEVNGNYARPPRQGDGAFEKGSLPRDHKTHVLCGPRMKICLLSWQYDVLEKAYNDPEPTKARAVIVQFIEVLESGMTPAHSVPKFSEVEKEFHTYLKSKGKVPPTITPKVRPTAELLAEDQARRAAKAQGRPS